MTHDEVIALMKTATTVEEWETCKKQVLDSCGGKYPDYWYNDIILSGIDQFQVSAATISNL